MRKTPVTTVVLGAVLLAVAGCGESSQLSVEQKYEHLREVANTGADAHYVLLTENKLTTREVCEQHYKVFVPSGAPAEYTYSGPARNTPEWNQLSLDYFIDSCEAGQPRVIQTRPTDASIPPSAPASATPAEVPPTGCQQH